MGKGLPGTANDSTRREAQSRLATRRTLLLSFVLVAASVALVWIVAPALDLFTPFSNAISLPWWALALGFAASGVLVFDIEVNRETHSFTFSEIPLVLGLLFAGP